MSAPSKRITRVKTVVRRIHMYCGLLLLPWLLFFGLSGLLFNHPNIGENTQGQRIQNDASRQIAAWDPDESAQRVLAQINEQESGWTIAPGYSAKWDGYAIYTAKIADGQDTVIWDVSKGRGIWARRMARDEPAGSHFPRRNLELEGLRALELSDDLNQLLRAQGREEQSVLRAHPRIAPRLRMVVQDPQGQVWNLEYSSAQGELSGRRRSDWPAIGMSQLFAKLHTTHHFTMSIGARWFWALFEDLLGLAMIFWSLSGIVMWWQLKKTRRWGVISLVVAILLALGVMVSTAQDITFGDIQQRLGPG